MVPTPTAFLCRWALLLALVVGSAAMTRAPNGGIGTPTYTLDVNGQLRVRGLVATDHYSGGVAGSTATAYVVNSGGNSLHLLEQNTIRNNLFMKY